MPTDTYKTIAAASEEILFKEKKSKFYGQAFPVGNESEVKPILMELKKTHHTANHICYAWRLGVNEARYRTNDDGEPNNSAGMPIYGQIQSYSITNVLVSVVRIFGGIKLGVGGLVHAYRTSAQMALTSAHIVERVIYQDFLISFRYSEMDQVMRVIKRQGLKISSQNMTLNCELTISVRKNEAPLVLRSFNEIQEVTIKKVN